MSSATIRFTAAGELNDLCDLDFVCAEFGEYPPVYLALAKETEGERSPAYLEQACERFGVEVPSVAAGDLPAGCGHMSGFAVGQGNRQRTTSHTLRSTPLDSGGSFWKAVIM